MPIGTHLYTKRPYGVVNVISAPRVQRKLKEANWHISLLNTVIPKSLGQRSSRFGSMNNSRFTNTFNF